MTVEMKNAPTPSKFSLSPLIWIGSAFALGIAFAGFGWLSLYTSTIATALFASLCLVLLKREFAIVFCLSAFIGLGSVVFHLEQLSIGSDRLKAIYDNGQIPSGDPLEVTGRIVSGPEPAYEGSVIDIDSENVTYRDRVLSVSGRVRLFISVSEADAQLDLERLDLGEGDRVRVATALERDERFRNPGTRSRKLILDHQGIDATGTIKSPMLIEVLSEANGIAPLRIAYDLRRVLIEDMRVRFSPETSGVLIASTLGDKFFLDRETAEVFRQGGTFHVLVISGLHITFIGGIIVVIVSTFSRDRRIQFGLAVVFLWIYALVVGAEPPVVRAATMFTIILFARVIYRNASMLNALGGCGLLLLFWKPSDLFNPSFQLTFISVASIVAFAFPMIQKLRLIGSWFPTAERPFPPICPKPVKWFCELLYWNEAAWRIDLGRQVWSARLFKWQQASWFGREGMRRIVSRVFEGLFVSTVVQIWLLPLSVVYFHRVSLTALILNIWVGVLLAIESIVAVVATAAGQFSNSLSLPFVRITELLNDLLIFGQRIFVMNEWADLRVPVYSGAMEIIYFVYFAPLLFFAGMAYVWEPFRSTPKDPRPSFGTLSLSFLSATVLAATIVLHPYSEPTPNAKLIVDYLDVGQGDAALVTFPNGFTLLIDGGGRPDYGADSDDDERFEPDVPRIGEIVVSEFLWEKGYSSVDLLLTTHADADHADGLSDVVSNFRVGKVIRGPTRGSSIELQRLLDSAIRRGVPVSEVKTGDRINVDGVTVEVIWPPEDRFTGLSDNNDSVVIRIVFGEHSFLFTGDIEKEAEERILYESQTISSSVVKVPHHGSRSSSTQAFIDAVRPDIAVIPVGRRSMFGHPHSEVVERWRAVGAQVITTGDRGTVSISSDGHKLGIETFLP